MAFAPWLDNKLYKQENNEQDIILNLLDEFFIYTNIHGEICDSFRIHEYLVAVWILTVPDQHDLRNHNEPYQVFLFTDIHKSVLYYLISSLFNHTHISDPPFQGCDFHNKGKISVSRG